MSHSFNVGVSFAGHWDGFAGSFDGMIDPCQEDRPSTAVDWPMPL